MFFRLLLLLTLVPLLELWLLTEIGIRIGVLNTFLLVIATGVMGASLAKWQGLATLRAIQDDLRERRMPAGRLLDGFMILIAGVLLLTPGILTDLMGLALLIPPIRRLVLLYVGAAIKARMTIQIQTHASGFSATATTRPEEPPLPPNVIDAEFERLE